jgi:hypothetical protein
VAVLIEPYPGMHKKASPEVRVPSPVLDVLHAMGDQPPPKAGVLKELS